MCRPFSTSFPYSRISHHYKLPLSVITVYNCILISEVIQVFLLSKFLLDFQVYGRINHSSCWLEYPVASYWIMFVKVVKPSDYCVLQKTLVQLSYNTVTCSQLHSVFYTDAESLDYAALQPFKLVPIPSSDTKFSYYVYLNSQGHFWDQLWSLVAFFQKWALPLS